MLPGGHTSKRVSVAMLLDRDVDTIVLYARPLPATWGHVVAARLARDPPFADYARVGDLPLGPDGSGYALFRR